jgi:cellulose synthase/poly-beta-1,6-N-acetylglucosamine synthase-like glycosyltransferase
MGGGATRALFWVSLTLVAYTYVLYPVGLVGAYAVAQLRRDLRYLAGRGDRRRSQLPDAALPPVSVVIASHDEETALPARLANLRGVDYPRDRLEVLFVSDGSTDGTNAILREAADPWVRALCLPARGGKVNAMNRGVAAAQHDLLVLSDTSTVFEPDTLRQLARHFADPAVGVVCGTIRFRGADGYGQTEGVYWGYESMLRLMEGRLGATLTASGALYAVRRAAYVPPPPDVWIEDFVVPMNARSLGYRVVYDPEAVATDVPASTVSGEFTRRVRLAAGSFHALGTLVRMPFHLPTVVAFVSHKLLRWLLPFLLIGLLATSLLLWDSPLYRLAAIGQLAFYAWAAAGWWLPRWVRRVPFGLLPYYLTAMHLAFLVGFVQFVRGRQRVAWQRVS